MDAPSSLGLHLILELGSVGLCTAWVLLELVERTLSYIGEKLGTVLCLYVPSWEQGSAVGTGEIRSSSQRLFLAPPFTLCAPRLASVAMHLMELVLGHRSGPPKAADTSLNHLPGNSRSSKYVFFRGSLLLLGAAKFNHLAYTGKELEIDSVLTRHDSAYHKSV